MMALERSDAVVLEPEAEGGYSVHIPAFRGAHTQGETIEECLANAREVIGLHAEVMTERGEPLPPSDVAKRTVVQYLPREARSRATESGNSSPALGNDLDRA